MGRRFDLGVCFGINKDGDNDYMVAFELTARYFPISSATVSAVILARRRSQREDFGKRIMDTWRRTQRVLPHAVSANRPACNRKIHRVERCRQLLRVEIWLPVKKITNLTTGLFDMPVSFMSHYGVLLLE